MSPPQLCSFYSFYIFPFNCSFKGVDGRCHLNLLALQEPGSLGAKAYKVLQEWKEITDLVPAPTNTQVVGPVLLPTTGFPPKSVDVDS